MDRRTWDPLDELFTLHESMTRLFEEMYTARPPLYRDRPVLWETDDEVVFRAEVPDTAPRAIDVRLSEDTLDVRAPGLTRTVPLPAAVLPGQAHATYRDGVLEVRMPKVGGERIMRLTVEAA